MLKSFINFFSIISLIILFSCTSIPKKYVKNQNNSLSQREIPVYIDLNFSGNDRVILGAALETWNYSFNGQLKLNIHYNTEPWSSKILDDVYLNHGIAIIFLAENDITVTLASDPFQAQKILAYVNNIGGDKIYVLRNRLNEKKLFYIALHELGHIFGATHSDGDDLMQPYYYNNSQACIDKTTAQKVAEHLLINFHSMNWCDN